MYSKKDHVGYLMSELETFKMWYKKQSGGFGGNKSMLETLEGELTALTMINFDGLGEELRKSINKVEEIVNVLSEQAGRANAEYTSHAFAVCCKALSILVNKLK